MLLLLQGVYKVSDFLSISRLSLSFVSRTYQQGNYNQTATEKDWKKICSNEYTTVQCKYLFIYIDSIVQ